MKFKCLIKNKYISTIIGSLSIFFAIAFVLPINTFSVYISSYIHIKQKFVTMHYGLFLHLIFGFSNTFSISIGGYLENYIGFYKTIIVGLTILFIANLGFIIQQNIWLCYFLCIFLGMGAGIATSLLGKNLIFYVPNKKGILTGIFGLGTMILVAIFSFGGEKIINFKGEDVNSEDLYDEDISRRTYIYFLIGECCIPVGLFLALMFIYEYKPEENNLPTIISEEEIEVNKDDSEKIEEVKTEVKDNNDNNDIDKPKNEGEQPLNIEITKKKVNQVIKTLRFWRLISITFFLNFSISFMFNTGRTFGAIIGIDGNALQSVGIIQLIAVIIMVPSLGKIVDKKGPLPVLKIISIICIFPGVLLALFMEKSIVFISSFVIFALGISGIMISFNPFVMEIYGIQESVILGGFLSVFTKISDIITTVSAFLFSIFCENDNSKDDEEKCLKKRYLIMYAISSVCCGVSSILLFLETKEKFKYKDLTIEETLMEKENENLIITKDNNFDEDIQIN